MPTPTSPSSPYIFSSHSSPPPHTHLLPSIFFFFPRFSTLQKWDWSIRGFTLRPTSLEDLKFPFRFNCLVWGKFERKTHSQPEDIQYDKKAGSYLITSCINTERASERRGQPTPADATQIKRVVYRSLYYSRVFVYDSTSFFRPGRAERMCTNTLTRPFSSSSSSLYGDSLLLSRSGKFLKFVMKLRSTPGGLYSADDEPEQRVRVSHLRAGRRTGFQVCEICTWVLASCSNPCKKASCQI